MRLRLQDIGWISVVLLLLILVVLPYFMPYFIPRVGTAYPYFGWTETGQLYKGAGLRVAIVKPVFSATAYSANLDGSGSFYEFYHKHANDPATAVITTDLNLLNVSVIDRWGWSDNLGRYLTEYVGDYGTGSVAAQSLTLLSDINVTEFAVRS